MKLEAGLESFSGKHADLHKDGHQQRPRALGCLQKPDKYSVMESNNWVWTKVLEIHEWISEFSFVMQENKILRH